MKYAIIGSGHVGTVLAHAFAHEGIEVAIANTRGPESLASLTKDLGRKVIPQTIQDACKADMVFLAVPFLAHKEVAKQLRSWSGKIVVDVTNTLDLTPKEREELLGDQLSSEVISEAFEGAHLVKAFNHLTAKQLGTNPPVKGQMQAVFISSNDVDASSAVAAVAAQLGFAPIELGRLDQGGVPLHAVGGRPGALLSQNLVKFGK